MEVFLRQFVQSIGHFINQFIKFFASFYKKEVLYVLVHAFGFSFSPTGRPVHDVRSLSFVGGAGASGDKSCGLRDAWQLPFRLGMPFERYPHSEFSVCPS